MGLASTYNTLTFFEKKLTGQTKDRRKNGFFKTKDQKKNGFFKP
jgi:hypothetical protein